MSNLFSKFRNGLIALRSDEAGATSIEYGLLASLIAIASMQALDTVGAALTDTFDTARGGLAGNQGQAAPEPPSASADEPSVAASRMAG